MPGYAAVFGATSGMSALSGYDVSTPSEYRGPLDQRVGTSLALAAIVGLMARDRSDGAVVHRLRRLRGGDHAGRRPVDRVAAARRPRRADGQPPPGARPAQLVRVRGQRPPGLGRARRRARRAVAAARRAHRRLAAGPRLGRAGAQGAGALDRRGDRRLGARPRSRRAGRRAAGAGRRGVAEHERARLSTRTPTSASAACGRRSTTPASARSRCSPCPGWSTAPVRRCAPPRRSASTTTTSTAISLGLSPEEHAALADAGVAY